MHVKLKQIVPGKLLIAIGMTAGMAELIVFL
jgi:hypothetical protein